MGILHHNDVQTGCGLKEEERKRGNEEGEKGGKWKGEEMSMFLCVVAPTCRLRSGELYVWFCNTIAELVGQTLFVNSGRTVRNPTKVGVKFRLSRQISIKQHCTVQYYYCFTILSVDVVTS